MTGRLLRRGLFAAGLAAVATLPVLGRALRSGGEERCSWNGVRIAAATRVTVRVPGGGHRVLCCVDCARRWIAASGIRPERVFVTDELTGFEIPAGEAWFVESRVVAFPVCGSHIHVFARENDARGHARDFGGVVLEGEGRPLR